MQINGWIERILKIMAWTGIIIAAPIILGFWFIVLIFIVGAILYGLIAYAIFGVPIEITQNGRRIGKLVRGKYYPD